MSSPIIHSIHCDTSVESTMLSHHPLVTVVRVYKSLMLGRADDLCDFCNRPLNSPSGLREQLLEAQGSESTR
jgi:hypothetical protein